MKVGILMFDRINLLSFAKIYDFLHKFEGFNIKTYALKPEIVDEFGVRLHPEIYAESLYGVDILVVPDGVGALGLRYDEIFLSWIKSSASAKFKIGFDLGVLILGGAGFLEDREACIRGGYKNALSGYCEVNDAKMCESRGAISVSEFDDEIKEQLAKILSKDKI